MKNQKGVSLVESLLVIVVIAAIVFLMANLPNAMNLISKSKHLSLAREIAAKQIEDKRSLSFANLVNDSAAISDSRIALLPNGSGTIAVEDYEESIKQITATVSWKDNNKNQIVVLKTLIGEGGLNQ